jgi:hypothetical protein
MDYSKLTLPELLEILERGDSAAILEILTKFRDTWNRLMDELRRLNKKVRLEHLVLKEANFAGLDLSNALIEDTDFSGSDMTGADLSGSVISASNFSYATLKDANLYSVRMSQTDMSKANLYHANLDKISLTGSVNVFDAYTGEFEYSTSPDRTKKGFRMAEGYEHDDDEEDDHGYTY